MVIKIKKEIRKFQNKQKAKILQGFFKRGKGEYGEGDVFLGLTSEQTKSVAKKYFERISLIELKELLSSKIHEDRMTALRMLLFQFEKGNEDSQKKIYNFYLKNTKYINNWDLVDVTADKILGGYLFDKKRDVLYKLAGSENLWERRMAIVSNLAFIRQNDFKDIIKLSKKLLNDHHDLMHKAIGWMLREMGKKDEQKLIEFLDKYSQQMPRTMLRYAIERMSKKMRNYYLKK